MTLVNRHYSKILIVSTGVYSKTPVDPQNINKENILSIYSPSQQENVKSFKNFFLLTTTFYTCTR